MDAYRRGGTADMLVPTRLFATPPEGWLRPFDPAPLRDAVREIGFVGIESALHDSALDLLSREAAEQSGRPIATVNDDSLPYRAKIAKLGGAAKAFLADAGTRDLLALVFEEEFVVSANSSCFTFYEPGGAFGAHCDQSETCEATLILYLDAQSPEPAHPETGLKLRIHGPTLREDGVAIAEIPTRKATLVLGRGARTWHERPCLRDGEHVAALTACFARAGAEPSSHG